MITWVAVGVNQTYGVGVFVGVTYAVGVTVDVVCVESFEDTEETGGGGRV